MTDWAKFGTPTEEESPSENRWAKYGTPTEDTLPKLPGAPISPYAIRNPALWAAGKTAWDIGKMAPKAVMDMAKGAYDVGAKAVDIAAAGPLEAVGLRPEGSREAQMKKDWETVGGVAKGAWNTIAGVVKSVIGRPVNAEEDAAINNLSSGLARRFGSAENFSKWAQDNPAELAMYLTPFSPLKSIGAVIPGAARAGELAAGIAKSPFKGADVLAQGAEERLYASGLKTSLGPKNLKLKQIPGEENLTTMQRHVVRQGIEEGRVPSPAGQFKLHQDIVQGGKDMESRVTQITDEVMKKHIEEDAHLSQLEKNLESDINARMRETGPKKIGDMETPKVPPGYTGHVDVTPGKPGEHPKVSVLFDRKYEGFIERDDLKKYLDEMLEDRKFKSQLASDRLPLEQEVARMKNEIDVEKPKKLTPREVHDFKQGLYKILGDPAYGKTAASSAVEAKKAVARAANDALIAQNPELASMNATEGSRINILKAIERATGRHFGNNLIPLGTSVTLGDGFWRDLFKFINEDAAVKSRVAIGINRVRKRAAASGKKILQTNPDLPIAAGGREELIQGNQQ